MKKIEELKNVVYGFIYLKDAENIAKENFKNPKIGYDDDYGFYVYEQ